MAIIFNGSNVSSVVFNGTNLANFKFNGTEVFEQWVEYTFPNSNAKLSSANSMGFNVYQASNNSDGYKIFDNNSGTYGGTNLSTTLFNAAIVFPFPILIKSVSITNWSGSSYTNNANLIVGKILVSPNVESAAFSPGGSNVQVYADVNRSSVSGTTGGKTTHSNSSFNGTSIRSIDLYSTKETSNWSGGSSNYGCRVGEMSVTFYVKASDLAAWKSQYSIS